ncbi:glycosyltransferase [Emticicia agri]|uniref:Glycosyltransferase family 1 protein n=1 Tax=Emticicia agri TaxID=2492393 RepID=A0A4Q5M4L8_9BACT|nr:glycosyltransferase [Emticicia agri]RYU96853.1 glycosyltransferase family 1 protein [Emticicia agri]
MPENKKIRILQTIRQGKIGGGETHVLDLVSTLDQNKYESVVLSFTEGPMVDKMKAMGVKTYMIYTEKPFDISVWDKVKTILIEEKIDIVHAHGTRANSNTYSSAKKLGIPLLYTVHGWSFHNDQNFLVKTLRTYSEKFLVKNATKTICVSKSNYEDGAKRFSMKNATVITNGINLAKFDLNKSFKNVRKEFNIKENEVLVGFIARMTSQKDPFTLLKAIAKIPADSLIKFLLVGDGDSKEEVLKMAEDLGINSRVIFESFREDIPDILHAIDIFCLPSLWEGLPIALLEAMAMAKAVVATAIDGTKEVIVHEKNGLLVQPSNPDELANALIRLANDKALREQLRKEARMTVEKNYNVARMTREVEKIYDELHQPH